jgi:hypothetical protein
MADSIQPAPGGCWALWGTEKTYVLNGQKFGYRRRFAFHLTREEGDGRVLWAPTRWMMKEYRLNKNAMMFHIKKPGGPVANLDFVIRKVFTKPAVPRRPPASSGQALQGVVVRSPSIQAQPAKVPVTASALAVRKDSTKTKTKAKKALQQGGSSLPPPSARPPRPPKAVATPVAPPPPAKVITTPVAPPRPPQVISTPVVPPRPPQVIARPVVSPAPRARSSQDEATSSRTQPGNTSANMELVVSRVPAMPVILPRDRWRLKPVPSGLQIIVQYLGPMAVQGQLPRGVTPGLVAQGVDVFAVSPDALPFPPSNRKQNGEVWGYFFAAKKTTSKRLAHRGCWMEYGCEKKYLLKSREDEAFHRRFAFHEARVAGDGTVAWEKTRWLMKEYRLNTDPAVCKPQNLPAGANQDLVVLKVFTKPMIPPPRLPPPPPPAPALHDVCTDLTL